MILVCFQLFWFVSSNISFLAMLTHFIGSLEAVQLYEWFCCLFWCWVHFNLWPYHSDQASGQSWWFKAGCSKQIKTNPFSPIQINPFQPASQSLRGIWPCQGLEIKSHLLILWLKHITKFSLLRYSCVNEVDLLVNQFVRYSLLGLSTVIPPDRAIESQQMQGAKNDKTHITVGLTCHADGFFFFHLTRWNTLMLQQEDWRTFDCLLLKPQKGLYDRCALSGKRNYNWYLTNWFTNRSTLLTQEYLNTLNWVMCLSKRIKRRIFSSSTWHGQMACMLWEAGWNGLIQMGLNGFVWRKCSKLLESAPFKSIHFNQPPRSYGPFVHVRF